MSVDMSQFRVRRAQNGKEDKTEHAELRMGAQPMGNLALNLRVAYYGGALIAFLLFCTFPRSSIASEGAFIAFLLFGVALFSDHSTGSTQRCEQRNSDSCGRSAPGYLRLN